MSWRKRFDVCSMDDNGDLIIIGGHYNLEESRNIIYEENYDEPKDWSSPIDIYVHFGLINFEGEVTNGFTEHSDYKKGRIKATRLELIPDV